MKGVVNKVGRVTQTLPFNPQLWVKLNLLKSLVQRDLEARYKGSVLGNWWPLLTQLSQLLIYTYVFSIVMKVKLNLPGLPTNDNITFGLWLFAGLLPWTAFLGGFIPASSAVLGQPNLVKKVVFPLALLPLVPVISAFIESTLGLIVLIVLIGFSAHTIHTTLWLLPLVWIPQFLLTAGLGYLSAGLTVFLRDIPQSLGVLTSFWFYLTPIVYPANIIPEEWRDWIFWLNPLAPIVEAYRDLILKGHMEHWAELGTATLISISIFSFGFWAYKRLRPAFADVL